MSLSSARPVGSIRAAVPLLLAVACVPQAPVAEPGPPEQRRAIVVSIDALSEERLRASLGPEAVPGLLGMFEEGACAEYTVAAFPSLTAPGHAALWTGAFGDVSGATGNSQPSLPRDQRTLTDLVSGYSAEVLRAEPVWITAGRSGRTVVGHHVTQGPQPPGYLPERGGRDVVLEPRRAESIAVLQRPEVQVLNGYNRMIAPHRVLTADSIAPRPATGWRNLDRLGRTRTPLREISWAVGTDSVHALFFGDAALDRVVVARERDVARGVTAAATPPEGDGFAGRPLARHFSEALEIPVEDGQVYLRVRLFHLAPDASSFMLYVPSLQVAEANRMDVQRSYNAAVRGWVGNSALRLFENGAFGPSMMDGGDGVAEARYLETVELVTRQFMRGAEWAWNEQRAELLLDYFPVGDEIDHAFYGYVDRSWPGYTAAGEAWAQRIRRAAWVLVDLRYTHLRELAASDPHAVLFVTGDHGMRATWRTFRPNAALREAGLLAVDAQGRIDLSRTRALSPNGYWINVNRTAWRGGIVPPQEEAEVLAAVERALLAVRDSAGERVVTRLFRPAEHPELGLGGPMGGDLYYGTAAGVRWTSAPTGGVLTPSGIWAGHGFPSTDRDMWTAFCAVGRPVPARRFAATRVVDVAPTVAEWLGMEAPRDAVGRSAWPEMSRAAR